MASAGLSDQIIIGAIKQATAKEFDLSPMGLVGLKKAGVSDAVIVAMQGGQVNSAAPPSTAVKSAPAPGSDLPPASGAVPSSVKNEDGVYLVQDSKLVRVEAKSPYQTRTGSTAVSRLTLGIKKARINAMLQGLSADVATTGTPSFYVHIEESESIGDYYLVRFTAKQQFGRRELEIASAGFGKAQAGFAEKDLFLVDAKRLDKNIYRVTPKVPLSPGEYALLVVPGISNVNGNGAAPRKIFDFSIR